MRNLSLFRVVCVAGTSSLALLATGCGLNNSSVLTKAPASTSGGALGVRGTVFGGQQPVGGASIGMYAVGTAGYGSAAVSILNNGVTVTSSTDGTGSFALTGKYTCSAEQRVYLTATGGNAGSGTNNAIAMMAALGRCGDLSASTFINLNEVTTVASVWALAPFMTSITQVGAPASNVTGINNAFADVNALASIARGAAGGDNLPAGATMPVATINTLANILAACINSTGSGNSMCSSLFTATAVGGVTPGDTLAAAINIAQHPANGVATIFPLASSTPPFQPSLVDQPSDFTLAATFANANLATPSSVAVDASGNAWVTDSSSNKLLTLAHNGAPLFVVPGLNAPSAVAVDQNGNGWVANSGNSTLVKVNTTGVVAGPYSGGGLNLPKSVSIDGQGNVWTANAGNNSVSEFNSNGTALSGSGFTSSGTTPIAIAITPN